MTTTAIQLTMIVSSTRQAQRNTHLVPFLDYTRINYDVFLKFENTLIHSLSKQPFIVR